MIRQKPGNTKDQIKKITSKLDLDKHSTNFDKAAKVAAVAIVVKNEFSKVKSDREKLEKSEQEKEGSKSDSSSDVELNLGTIGVSHMDYSVFSEAGRGSVPQTGNAQAPTNKEFMERLREGYIRFEIEPCMAIFSLQPPLNKFFRLENSISKYTNFLKKQLRYNVITEGSGLKVYAKPDSVQGGGLNISNSYGEHLFENIASPTLSGREWVSELVQLTGGHMDNSLNMIYDALGRAATGGIDAASSFLGADKNNKISSALKSVASGAVDLSKTALGERITFPKVWKGGNASTELSFSVRLGYVPVVTDDDLIEYKKHVLGPLSALVLLAIPQSDEGTTYKWPFYLKIKSPGICDFKMAAISSLSVQPVDYTQSTITQIPPAFDVNITIVSLDDNMVFVENEESANNETVNSLQRYLSAIGTPKDTIILKTGSFEESTSVIDKLRGIARMLKTDPENIKMVDPNTVKIIGKEASKIVGNVVNIERSAEGIDDLKRDVINQLDAKYKDVKDKIYDIKKKF